MSELERVAASEALPYVCGGVKKWPDREADYVAETDSYAGSVRHIYLHGEASQKGVWLWAMQADGHEISRNVGELHGAEQSARAAAQMVEDAWFKAISGSSLDMPPSTRNAYARAKSGE